MRSGSRQAQCRGFRGRRTLHFPPCGAPQTGPARERVVHRPVSRPSRASAHERPGRASRGVIRGGARGGRAAGGGPLRRERGHVVTGLPPPPPPPALFSFWSGQARRLRERSAETEGERGKEEGRRTQGVGAGEPFCATAPTCRRSRPASPPPRDRLRPPRAAAAAEQACGAARGAPPGAEWGPGRGKGGPQPRAGGQRCSSGPRPALLREAGARAGGSWPGAQLPSCASPCPFGGGRRASSSGRKRPKSQTSDQPGGEERFAFEGRNTALSEYDFSVFTCESKQVEAFQDNEKQS
ncbi:hypothetical protein MUG91_G28n17 [Manis pentadactyla]|nr:hypothetical protein MUG91_G28n17 [Manis pentadactyla]